MQYLSRLFDNTSECYKFFWFQAIITKVLEGKIRITYEELKALGRKVRNFDETIWNEIKYATVLNGNYLKFTQNSELRKFLLSTGDSVLVEASPYDGIWGIKMGETDENARNPLKWNGENLLGFALMEVRDEIRRVWKNADICS